jgi:hypothetical protein
MTNLKIYRKEFNSTETLSHLMIEGSLFGFVLEPPVNANKQDISCIPAGVYKYKKYSSQKYGCICLAIYDVPGRTNVKMHYGNYPSDTEGCLLVGLSIDNKIVMNSRKALASLISKIDDEGYIMIRDCF